MCGIVGYIGGDNACDVLISGLRKLEYRGYDSAGIAILKDAVIEVRKSVGKLKALEAAVQGKCPAGTIGIGHTRWATHGRPSDENAHPHADCSGKLSVVHNGIIENYAELKADLVAAGHTFTSETDTEVIAHLVESFYQGDLCSAVRLAAAEMEGSFGLVVMCSDEPDKLVAARRHSPLVLGIGVNENLVASDVSALLAKTRDAVYLDDDTFAVLTRDDVRLYDQAGNELEKNHIPC